MKNNAPKNNQEQLAKAKEVIEFINGLVKEMNALTIKLMNNINDLDKAKLIAEEIKDNQKEMVKKIEAMIESSDSEQIKTILKNALEKIQASNKKSEKVD